MRWLAAVVGLAIAASVPAALGHGPITFGHSQTGYLAPPQDLYGRDVAVSMVLKQPNLYEGREGDVNLQVRFFGMDTWENIPNTTYQIEIWDGARPDGDLLARNIFFDEDGRLDIKVTPKAGCDGDELSKCTVYGGSQHVLAPEALFVRGEECNDGNLDICARPSIAGPVFTKGGLYNIWVVVEATPDDWRLAKEPLEFDTFVSIPQEQYFELPGVSGPEPIIVPIRTYYDDVDNFAFDRETRTISFDMDFDWSPDRVGLVQIVSQDVGIPPAFAKAYGTGFRGFVNGIEVGPGSDHPRGLLPNLGWLGSDDVHFMLDTDMLQDIAERTGQDGPGRMLFELVAGEPVPTESARAELVDLGDLVTPVPVSVDVSWPGRYGYGDKIPFLLEFRDVDGRMIQNVRYDVSLYDHAGQELAGGSSGSDPFMPGITAPAGIDVQVIKIPEDEGLYRLDVRILGSGLDYTNTHAGIGSALLYGLGGMAGGGPADPTAAIPAWIRTSAGLWVDGRVDDAAFAGSLQFLINRGVISVGDTEQGAATSSGIPEWIRQSTGLWVDGQVDDATFAGSLRFLIREGIIQAGGAPGAEDPPNDSPDVEVLLDGAPVYGVILVESPVTLEVRATDTEGDPISITVDPGRMSGHGAIRVADRGDGTAHVTLDPAGIPPDMYRFDIIVSDPENEDVMPYVAEVR